MLRSIFTVKKSDSYPIKPAAIICRSITKRVRYRCLMIFWQ